jgi:hypothetical protein
MSTTPTLTITGSGGKNIATNTITFNFSEAIRNGSFSVDDIRISNGSINAGSFTKISDTQYTIVVTPSLGGQHSNVAITVLANTFVDIVGNTNTACALKHPGHISHIANIPIANVLVKRGCVIKCFARITYMGYIPTR